MTSQDTESSPSPRDGTEVPGTAVLGDGEALPGILQANPSSTTVTAGDAATEYPGPKISPAAERVFKRCREMQAGTIPLPTSPTQEFKDLTRDMWTGIKPYDVDPVSDGTDLLTRSYNKMHTDLVAKKYRNCLALVENHLNVFYSAELNRRGGRSDLPLGEGIHFWKLCTMKMMIMPVALLAQSEAWIRGSLTKDLRYCVMLKCFGAFFPAHIFDQALFFEIIFEEVQRHYLLFQQTKKSVKTGGDGEDGELRDEARWGQMDDQDIVMEKTGFLPVTEELFGLRMEYLCRTKT
ncbi:MAG: hypothetical protein Q9209_002636 [Squamulea sp. 1 TL-2023]